MSKILVAAGGSGGHLLPAQAFARQVMNNHPSVHVLFAGSGLVKSHCFDRQQFPFVEITSGTLFHKNPWKMGKSLLLLLKGIWQSLRLVAEEKPAVVVGFGSFHCFPLLCAASILRTPIVLFEANTEPGRVIRLFAKHALCTAIAFEGAKERLKGKTADVFLPIRGLEIKLSKKEAREQLKLDPNLPTLLIFGGSQGARGLNEQVPALLKSLVEKKVAFQLIHLTGRLENEVERLCHELGILAYIKPFEEAMNTVWSATTVAICRAGAATMTELIEFEIPALLVPYPHAADNHQLKNALFMEKKVKGALHFEEGDFSSPSLLHQVLQLLDPDSALQKEMKNGIKWYKQSQKKQELSTLVMEYIKDGA